jgi:hypothetical protein
MVWRVVPEKLKTLSTPALLTGQTTSLDVAAHRAINMGRFARPSRR